jgi:hypothetical protein
MPKDQWLKAKLQMRYDGGRKDGYETLPAGPTNLPGVTNPADVCQKTPSVRRQKAPLSEEAVARLKQIAERAKSREAARHRRRPVF